MNDPSQNTIDNNDKFVGFWVRFGASIIDTILLLLIIFPLIFILYGKAYFVGTHILQGVPDILINYGLPMLFTIMFWIYKAATPGKLSLNIEIVDAISGEKPTAGQAIIRYIGYYISLLPFGLGFFWVAWDKKKQGWHDKMAGTVVVKSVQQID